MELPAPASPTLEAAKSLVAYLGEGATSEKKVEYLSYRYTGFSLREACELAGIRQVTVMRWRDPKRRWYDAEFVKLEKAAAGPDRAQFRKEVLHLLFLRNYHLVLRHDYAILERVAGRAVDEEGQVVEPTKADFQYLNRMRAHYSPQQLEVLEKLLDPASDEAGFNISEFLVRMVKRTEREVTTVEGIGRALG